MKRGKPLKRTAMKRGQKQMKRKALARGGKQIKKRSSKTQKLYTEKRIPLVIKILDERPICEICLTQRSTEVHEKLTRGRSGGVHGDAWLDEGNCMALCHWCHSWVTQNPKEAESSGFMLKSQGLDKNDTPS